MQFFALSLAVLSHFKGALIFVNLGDNWATTLLAFITLVCAPIPILFMRHGMVMRTHSHYIPSARETGLIFPIIDQFVELFPAKSSKSLNGTRLLWCVVPFIA
jgi:hypothetical protein